MMIVIDGNVNGSMVRYLSDTTYYYGGGMYVTVLRYRFKVVVDT